jgi:hypothetical protein
MRQVYQEQVNLAELNDFDDLVSFQNRMDLIKEYSPDLEQQRIFVMNKLHQIGTKAPSIIGFLLVKQEEVIKSNFESWAKMHKKETDKPPVASLREWFIQKSADIIFSYQTARQYIVHYGETDPAVMDELGTYKLNIIRKAPKDEREVLQKKAIEYNWNATKLNEEVSKVKLKYENETDHVKKPAPNIFLDIRQKGANVTVAISGARDNELLAQALVNWLASRENTIKSDLINAVKKQKK